MITKKTWTEMGKGALRGLFVGAALNFLHIYCELSWIKAIALTILISFILGAIFALLFKKKSVEGSGKA